MNHPCRPRNGVRSWSMLSVRHPEVAASSSVPYSRLGIPPDTRLRHSHSPFFSRGTHRNRMAIRLNISMAMKDESKELRKAGQSGPTFRLCAAYLTAVSSCTIFPSPGYRNFRPSHLNGAGSALYIPNLMVHISTASHRNESYFTFLRGARKRFSENDGPDVERVANISPSSRGELESTSFQSRYGHSVLMPTSQSQILLPTHLCHQFW